MRAACLIPSTRPVDLPKAVASAAADGWEPLTLPDTVHNGVNKTREALMARAFATPDIEFIRYLDDDDLLLPHREAVLEVFQARPDVDVVYTDALIHMPSGVQHAVVYSGDPVEDLMRVHPWSWVARTSALRDVKRIWGYVWDYGHPCREGNYCWLRFLKSGLSFAHVPLQGYHYNKSFAPECISQHPEFPAQTRLLEAEVGAYLRTRRHA